LGIRRESRALPPPAIKWAGSKRSQSAAIAACVPPHGRYVEPFVGGGAVLYQLSPEDGLAGDICEPLIQLWERVKCEPAELGHAYREHWERLQKEGQTYYYEVRERFNRRRDPSDFLFLSRTCVNGLIRFNRRGEFNNSFHLSRPGIHPSRLESVIKDWSMRVRHTEFVCQDYRVTLGSCAAGDLIYLDPPYANTRGRYYGGIDPVELFDEIRSAIEKGALVILSYDGRAGDTVYRASVPGDLFPVKRELVSGNSPFRKTQGGYVAQVRESLYLSFDPGELRS
jgi:DNA adenine methylase